MADHADVLALVERLKRLKRSAIPTSSMEHRDLCEALGGWIELVEPPELEPPALDLSPEDAAALLRREWTPPHYEEYDRRQVSRPFLNRTDRNILDSWWFPEERALRRAAADAAAAAGEQLTAPPADDPLASLFPPRRTEHPTKRRRSPNRKLIAARRRQRRRQGRKR